MPSGLPRHPPPCARPRNSYDSSGERRQQQRDSETLDQHDAIVVELKSSASGVGLRRVRLPPRLRGYDATLPTTGESPATAFPRCVRLGEFEMIWPPPAAALTNVHIKSLCWYMFDSRTCFSIGTCH